MDKNELKQIVIKEVDKLKEDITELGDDIYKHPETGPGVLHNGSAGRPVGSTGA